MKDQVKLLRDCIHKDIPAVVFQGDDSCAPEILEAAKEIYRRHGCVRAYQKESPQTVKLPKLSPVEAELVREEMKRQTTHTS